MNENETKLGMSSIIYSLIRNLEYDSRKDELRRIERLNFIVYLTDPYIGTDQRLDFTPIVDEFSLPVTDCSIDVDVLMKRATKLKGSEALGISSRVQTGKGVRHIGMIDFLTENGSLEKSIATIEQLKESGFIVASSNAYNTHHFYSTRDLLKETDFKGYMEKLKTLESVGPNWLNLQIDQGCALLRIAPCRDKKDVPYIVTHIR